QRQQHVSHPAFSQNSFNALWIQTVKNGRVLQTCTAMRNPKLDEAALARHCAPWVKKNNSRCPSSVS
ncbi:MAG: hypothetical protein JZU63_06210, partial [Rhodoferax sp.]|nr:hypothetical protein [Rhodoferax sp.]